MLPLALEPGAAYGSNNAWDIVMIIVHTGPKMPKHYDNGGDGDDYDGNGHDDIGPTTPADHD